MVCNGSATHTSKSPFADAPSTNKVFGKFAAGNRSASPTHTMLTALSHCLWQKATTKVTGPWPMSSVLSLYFSMSSKASQAVSFCSFIASFRSVRLTLRLSLHSRTREAPNQSHHRTRVGNEDVGLSLETFFGIRGKRAEKKLGSGPTFTKKKKHHFPTHVRAEIPAALWDERHLHQLQLAALFSSYSSAGRIAYSRCCQGLCFQGSSSISCSGVSTCQCSFHSCSFTSALFRGHSSSKTSSRTCAPPLHGRG